MKLFFERNLRIGIIGEDVKALQSYLNEKDLLFQVQVKVLLEMKFQTLDQRLALHLLNFRKHTKKNLGPC